MVVSQIRSLYRDENDLFRTVTKRIYEVWDAELEQWHLKKVEYRNSARVADSTRVGIHIRSVAIFSARYTRLAERIYLRPRQ